PHRDSEREYNEPQIHGVAGKLVGSAENQLVICGRGWAHFGALAPEQENGPNGQNAAYRDKSHSQRHERQTGDVRPAEPPANCRGDNNINESPNGWWHLEHHRRSLGRFAIYSQYSHEEAFSDKRNRRSSEDCVEAEALVRTRHANETVHENQEQANLMAAPARRIGRLDGQRRARVWEGGPPPCSRIRVVLRARALDRRSDEIGTKPASVPPSTP